jgi:hypothetical protein
LIGQQQLFTGLVDVLCNEINQRRIRKYQHNDQEYRFPAGIKNPPALGLFNQPGHGDREGDNPRE